MGEWIVVFITHVYELLKNKENDKKLTKIQIKFWRKRLLGSIEEMNIVFMGIKKLDSIPIVMAFGGKAFGMALVEVMKIEPS